MNMIYPILIVAVVLVLALAVALILGPVLARRKRSERLQEHFGAEYDHAVKQALGDEEKAQKELEERQKHVETLDIQPLSAVQHDLYLADWLAVQSKFVDEPGQAIVDADRLIMEVMLTRAYPTSDFDERAADLSVNYPALVSNYRAAREIALKNEQHQADTEELRQAMIYYHSLFEELLESEATVV